MEIKSFGVPPLVLPVRFFFDFLANIGVIRALENELMNEFKNVEFHLDCKEIEVIRSY